MKKLTLIVLAVIMLAGCQYQSAYTLYDSHGCAYTVLRNQLSNIPGDEWNTNGGSFYQSRIQRDVADDKDTCTLGKKL